jgi:D-alanine-D-alanine ligase
MNNNIDEPGSSNNNSLILPKKVAILYSDVKREYFASEELYLSEQGADEYAAEVAKYVAKMGIDVLTIAGDENMAVNLQKYQPDMAMNLIDSVRGQSTLGSSIPGVLEVLHIPYTGAGTLGWALGTNKYLMYQLLQTAGVPVPTHQLVVSSSDMIDPELRYPLFPKLNYEHSSIGVDENSICKNEKELRAKLKDLITTFKQPVLIDEFIAGIEVTAAVLDGKNTKVYAVQRKVEGGTEDVVTFDKKWRDYLTMTYSKFEDPMLKMYVKDAFDILKMSDYGRIDIRVDGAGRYYFIDPNANPFFGPPVETHATYSMILDMYGVSFEETLKRMFVNTLEDARSDHNGWH